MESVNTAKTDGQVEGVGANSLSIAFCGGGSGGHLTPAFAIAEVLQRQRQQKTIPGLNVLFVTSRRPVDARMVQAFAGSDREVQHLPLPLTTSRRRILYLLKVIRCVYICVRAFRRQRPRLLVSTGGFAALPGLIAGRLLAIPILLIEPNAVVGKVHRRTLKWAAEMCRGWQTNQTTASDCHCATTITGVPIRDVSSDLAALPKKRMLLILGGSLGAARLNQLASAALLQNVAPLANWQIVHQTGPRDEDKLSAAYRDVGLDVQVQPFIDDLQPQLQMAAIVITRAGAVTLAECCRAHCAMLIVPLSTAADDHQAANAGSLVQRNAALVIDESAENAEQMLSEQLRSLLPNAEQREQLAQNASQLATPHAAVQVASRILDLAE